MMISDNEIIRVLSLIHLKKVRNKNVVNKKVLICFAGIPGAGKTFLAKLIEKKYRAVRITSDEIRKSIMALGKKKYPELAEEARREDILRKYLDFLIEKCPFKNGLLLIDSGIERKYSKVLRKSKENGFSMIVINVETSMEEATRRVMRKAGWEDKHFTRNIDRWMKEHEEFLKKVKPDLTLKNDGNLVIRRDFFDKLKKVMNNKGILKKHKV